MSTPAKVVVREEDGSCALCKERRAVIPFEWERERLGRLYVFWVCDVCYETERQDMFTELTDTE